VAEEAMTQPSGDGDLAACRRLDAEDATLRHALDWAMEHDTGVAARLAAALAWWWQIRGRLAGQVPLLREAVDRAAQGSDAWCLGHTWLGQAALDSADPAGALRHFTAVVEAIGARGASFMLVRCLIGRCVTLLTTGRILDATDDARRAVALAREGHHPLGEALALAVLGLVACAAHDRVGAVQLALRAEQILAGRHGPVTRVCSYVMTTVLIHAGDVSAFARRRWPGPGTRVTFRAWGTCWRRWWFSTWAQAVIPAPPCTCGKDSRPPCGPGHGPGCSTTWTAAGTCAH
jgi:hypothetical protein